MIDQTILDEDLQGIAVDATRYRGMIGSLMIALEKSQPNVIYKVPLEILKHYSFYYAFIATANAPQIYMQHFWYTITYDLTAQAYFFTMGDQEFKVNAALLRNALRKANAYDRPRLTMLQMLWVIVTGSNVGGKEHGSDQGGNEPAGDAQVDDEIPPLVDTIVTLILDTTTSSPTQPPPTQPRKSKIKIILKKSHNPESQADDTSLENRVYRLKRRVDAMLKFNIQEAVDKFVEARLKQIDLSKDVPDFSRIKQEKAAKQNMPKHSSTLFNKATLAIHDQKDKLYKMIREFKAYNRRLTHKSLFNALVVSLSVDKDDMDKLEDPPLQKKRRRDDHDKDISADADKDSKKKKRKDHDVSSSTKTKDQPTSSKGTNLSKSLKTDKTMQAEETIEDHDQEARMDEELNPEGDRILQDLNKPLPNLDALGHLYILVDLLFNKDLEYLRFKNLEEKIYATSLAKPKAVRYGLYKIKEMIPNMWSPSKVVYEKDAAYGISH
nr:hypothetical protein [Tanacetum cinerariifolium]